MKTVITYKDAHKSYTGEEDSGKYVIASALADRKIVVGTVKASAVHIEQQTALMFGDDPIEETETNLTNIGIVFAREANSRSYAMIRFSTPSDLTTKAQLAAALKKVCAKVGNIEPLWCSYWSKKHDVLFWRSESYNASLGKVCILDEANKISI